MGLRDKISSIITGDQQSTQKSPKAQDTGIINSNHKERGEIDDITRTIAKRLIEHLTKGGAYDNDSLQEAEKPHESMLVETPVWRLARTCREETDVTWSEIESRVNDKISSTDWEDWEEVRPYLDSLLTEDEWEQWRDLYEPEPWTIMLLYDIDHMDGGLSNLQSDLPLETAGAADFFIHHSKRQIQSIVVGDQDSPRTPKGGFPPEWSQRGFVPHPIILPVHKNVDKNL